MNVALTRAREFLYVVGDPDALEKDSNWGQWLVYESRLRAAEEQKQ